MKIATLNIQNLFHRDLSFLKQNASKNLQDWMEEFQHLLRNPKKEEHELNRMRELAFLMGFSPQTTEPFLTLRRKGGHLYVKPLGSERQSKATERVGWNGWVELRSYPLDEGRRQPKVECIAQAAPDILVLQEVEDRPSLSDFNREYLGPKLGGAFDQWLFAEGNDPRGLGHAILARNGYRITGFQTHAHERDATDGDLFGMDCPEFTIVTPNGTEITIISARFQGDGLSTDFHAKRKEQAQRVHWYCNRLKAEGKDKIVVCGYLGEVAYGDALRPLLGGKWMRDIPQHLDFDAAMGKGPKDLVGGEPYKGWSAKHDYLLSSPALYGAMQRCGVQVPLPQKGQKGITSLFSNPKGYSDNMAHPMLWAEFDV
ncbi:hypothetical protein [Flagellimonas sp. SN16]|uniref:hypothetical protein n=1 Tax=Flagellimonas sp. SN16 TaxID=3415142 RepID=UPI003C688AF9